MAESPITHDLRAFVKSIENTLDGREGARDAEDVQILHVDLQRIHQVLIENSGNTEARSAFRHVNGFETLLHILRAFSGYYDAGKLSKDDRAEFFELLKAVLNVLSEGLGEHSGNRRYFAKRVEDGGWHALEQALIASGVASCATDDGTSLTQLFGLLLSFALAEDTFYTTFRRFARTDDAVKEEATAARTSDSINKEIGGPFSGNEMLRNPEIVPIIFNFWRLFLTPSESANALFATAVISALSITSGISIWNAVKMHDAGLLALLLPLYLKASEKVELLPRLAIGKLCQSLIRYGITNLDDARLLYRQAQSSDAAATFLHDALQHARPQFIQFDLSIHGFSSVELPMLGRPFPPKEHGYTISTWFCVDKFDSGIHTTIFGAYDASQTSFILLYLEKGTQYLILQTSITATRPSVRFKGFQFSPDVWYHVAIVHERPRFQGSSSAHLYVNGQWIEKLKVPWPNATPTSAGPDGAPRMAAVQAFLGTPQEVAPRFGKNVWQSKLSVASFHLIYAKLTEDVITVYRHLGPRYSGNFQDILASFMTYSESAAMNRKNEDLHPDNIENSDMSKLTRQKASFMIPESSIVLSLSPSAVLDNDDQNNVNEARLSELLSKEASRMLKRLIRAGGQAVMLNAAVPSINSALAHPYGVAILTGEPVVSVPQMLDEASWRLSGCAATGLKLVELAHTKDSVLRATQILFDSLSGSWRNSEAIERDGYQVLAGILREKLGMSSIFTESGNGSRDPIKSVDPNHREELALELLRLILRFVGYNEREPTRSLLNNPLAYRILLVDFDTWRRAPIATQKIYYSQFLTFASKECIYYRFNTKRLIRMRIVKQFYNALKGETFSKDVFPDFLEAFAALFQCNVNTENLRNLALFITYTFHESRAAATRSVSKTPATARKTSQNMLTPASESSTPRSATPLSGNVDQSIGPYEAGVRVLEAMDEILCMSTDRENIMKFAKTVATKWLVFQLDERTDERVIVLTVKLLFRTLIVQPPDFIKRFGERHGGFTILTSRLKMWWNTPAIWTLCFALMFKIDPATINLEQEFNMFTLSDIFGRNKLQVVNPEVMPIIAAMLEYGLKEIIRTGNNASNEDLSDGPKAATHKSRPSIARERSMSLNVDKFSRASSRSSVQRLAGDADVLNTVTSFLRDLYTESPGFREWAATSNYTQHLLFVLYPVIVTADKVSAETELLSRGSALTFEGKEVVMRPHVGGENIRPPVVLSSNVEPPPSPDTARAAPFRRASSFVLLSTETSRTESTHSRFSSAMSPTKTAPVELRVSNGVVDGLLTVITNVFLDQILKRKDFGGFGLFLKVPPGFQEHQAYFESFILKSAMKSLSNQIRVNQSLLTEPRVINNLSRYASYMAEALFEGWFIDSLSAEPLLEFTGQVLEHLQKPSIRVLKSVRLCDAAISILEKVFMRVTLYQLSSMDEMNDEKGATAFMQKLTFWQPVIIACDEMLPTFLRLLFYLLYVKYCSPVEAIRVQALDFWRSLIVQKEQEASRVLTEALQGEQRHLAKNFMSLAELDNEAFMAWTGTFKAELDSLFGGSLAKEWDHFVSQQDQETEKTAEHRINKRREKLKMWRDDEAKAEQALREHENAGGNWRRNIYVSERLKHQRAMQDQQDNLTYTAGVLNKFDQVLKGPCGLYEDEPAPKWRLDETEGEHRMRLKVVPDRVKREDDYQPKRKLSEYNKTPKKHASLKLETNNLSVPSGKDLVGVTPASSTAGTGNWLEPGRQRASSQSTGGTGGGAGGEDDFEVIDDPKVDEDGFEDKNRRVMRTLERGDQIQHLFNVSRIIALEACEGLLIFGKQCLYLIDNFLQRADGEVIRVWQATAEERDPYLQLLPDQDPKKGKTRQSITDQTSRHWKWSDVMVISKRSFLLRDVAIELFFTDGRSYLLTARSKNDRDELFKKLMDRAPHLGSSSGPPFPEDAWRLDSWRNPEEIAQGFLAKFTMGASKAATKQWQLGEMSNFHYLMLLNTMAGRTFNDLTQYPVFPWVLADYTSEVLDLTDSKSFRDLSKPMGIQTKGTDGQARERYVALRDIGGDIGPYHFSTHYSSATTVSSYLIRLQPFVQAYVAVQGGKFDVADRMFGSIRGAWEGASGINAQDVRELTPEFFYLPDFLVNKNNYSFGTTASGEELNHVALPPWAKGSPEIFIQKHREALESPYVSLHLHRWIDLIFGYKQIGQPAIDSLNLFHPYSYAGARNLDEVEDADTRKSMANIIHSFGQTPQQIFTRPHPGRDEVAYPFANLENVVDELRGPMGLFSMPDRIANISERSGRVVVSGPFKLHIPPAYDKSVEWGFVDGSVRFFAEDGRKLLGMFEHLHIGAPSTALFSDSRTLVTAGNDCVVSIWNVEYPSSRFLNVILRTSLFGHRHPVTALASSNRFMALLTSDTSGRVLMWDLNRNEFVRELEAKGPEVRMARIDNQSGNVLLARGKEVKITTLNGVVLVDQRVCEVEDDEVVSIAWAEPKKHEWLDRTLFVTGHRVGLVKTWQLMITKTGSWGIALVRALDAHPQGHGHGHQRESARAAVTCVLPVGSTIYAGDEMGRVVSFSTKKK